MAGGLRAEPAGGLLVAGHRLPRRGHPRAPARAQVLVAGVGRAGHLAVTPDPRPGHFYNYILSPLCPEPALILVKIKLQHEFSSNIGLFAEKLITKAYL